MGAMFIATMFIGCLNACLVQPVMYVERTVFYRERAAGVHQLMLYCMLSRSGQRFDPLTPSRHGVYDGQSWPVPAMLAPVICLSLLMAR